MPLIVAGVNHRTAPIEVREKLAFTGRARSQLLDDLRARPSLTEAALLSTCNRTEAYVVDTEDSVGLVRELYTAQLGHDVSPFLYVRHDREAALHLFRVASGLDSMILGEAQIQGQVRDAWTASRETTGAALNRLFQHAQLVGSRVREETGIGRGAASVSSSAVQLARKIRLCVGLFWVPRSFALCVLANSRDTYAELLQNGNDDALVLPEQRKKKVQVVHLRIACTTSESDSFVDRFA